MDAFAEYMQQQSNTYHWLELWKLLFMAATTVGVWVIALQSVNKPQR